MIKNYGLSLYQRSAEILKVVGKSVIQERSCMQKLFQIQDASIPLDQNSMLPQWIKCRVTPSKIKLSGKPKDPDIGVYRIQIYNKSALVVKEIIIELIK